MELCQSLDRLREISLELSTSSGAIPELLKPFYQLVQTQTAIIEAFIACEALRSSATQCQIKEEIDETPVAHPLMQSHQVSSHSVSQKAAEPAIDPGTDCESDRSWFDDKRLSFEISSLLGRPLSTISERTEPEDEQHQLSTSNLPSRLRIYEGVPALVRERSQEPSSPFDVSPLTPERSWFRDPTPRVSLLLEDIPSLKIPPRQSSQRPKINVFPPDIVVEPQRQHRYSTTVAEHNCEALVQEAISVVISEMKERRKVPVGRMKGSFVLYSSEYRKIRSDQQDADLQQLTVFQDLSGWESSIPDLKPPKPDEIAMGLIIYPRCRLLVKPFTPPTNADWKWHSLKAIDVTDQEEKTIEIMFLGNGFIKLKLRLGELLGDTRGPNERDRFVEFSGIWQNPKTDLRHQRASHMSRLGKEFSSPAPTFNSPIPTQDWEMLRSPKTDNHIDSGFYSRGPSRNSRSSGGSILSPFKEFDSHSPGIWSPVSPLEAKAVYFKHVNLVPRVR